MVEISQPAPPPATPSLPLSAADFSAAVTAITSAFGDPTRRDIYLWIRDGKGGSVGEPTAGGTTTGVTATEVAERFELHPNVARHHLDKLAGGGYLEVTTVRGAGAGGRGTGVGGRGAGSAGRPSRRYAVTERSNALELPVRHDDLLIALLGRALSRLPAAEAEAMAEEVGAEYGRTMAATVRAGGDPARSFRSALHTVADALTAHGFSAHAESRDGRLRIISEHCPFGDAAIEHPVICAVDRGMVRGMLGALYGETDTATERSLARGDDDCAFAVDG